MSPVESADRRAAVVAPRAVRGRRVALVSRRHVDFGRMSSAICQA